MVPSHSCWKSYAEPFYAVIRFNHQQPDIISTSSEGSMQCLLRVPDKQPLLPHRLRKAVGVRLDCLGRQICLTRPLFRYIIYWHVLVVLKVPQLASWPDSFPTSNRTMLSKGRISERINCVRKPPSLPTGNQPIFHSSSLNTTC